MDLLSLLRVLGKRWYITVPLLLVSLTGVAVIASGGPAGYKSSNQIVVLAPKGTNAAQNPYLQSPGGQNLLAQLLSQQMVKPEFVAEVQKRYGVNASWTVTLEPGFSVLDLAVTDTRQARASSDAQHIFDVANDTTFVQLQAGAAVPASALASLQFLGPGPGVAQYGHTIKVAAALGIVALGLSVALVFGIDALLRRPRRKRGTRRGGISSPEGPTRPVVVDDDGDDLRDAGFA